MRLARPTCRPLDRNRVECFSRGHRRPIALGLAGVCKVRFNRDGKLFARFGLVSYAFCDRIFCDPIEKSPAFTLFP